MWSAVALWIFTLGALAVYVGGAGEEAIRALWRGLPRSWVSPQMVVAARHTDPHFEARALDALQHTDTTQKARGALAWSLQRAVPMNADARQGANIAQDWEARIRDACARD